MPVKVRMPALSPTMEEGTLAKWLVSEGDKVNAGDPIAEIETDKATMEVEAVEEGRLGRILVTEGTEGVPVNAVIALLLEEDEEPDALDEVDLEEPAPAKGDGGNPKGEGAGAAEKLETARAAKSSDAEGRKPQPPAMETRDGPTIPEGTEMAEITVREALRDALIEEMRRDERVFLMGEEVGEYEGAYKVSQGLLAEFGPKRVVDTPITEHAIAGVGVGAAFGNLRPIVEFMTWNFAMQAMDQLINTAAKTRYMSGGQMGVPMVFRGPNGAASRVAAQHSQDFSSWYAHIPGLIVIAPYSAADAKGLLKAAIRDPNPVIFLEHELLYGRAFEVPVLDNWVLPIGKARIVREGEDVTIASFSNGMTYALEAAERLAGEGMEAEVIDLRTLRPLDTAAIVESVRKTNRLVTVEEGWPRCGFGAEIAAVVMEEAFDYLDAPVARVTGEDAPMPYAANLEKLMLPSADKVVEAVRKVCYL